MRKAIYVIATLFFLLVCVPAFADRFYERTSYPKATCKEFPRSIFKPCICWDRVPKSIRYRTSLPECGGRAAAILSGDLLSAFSVVLRDNQNRDRWPPANYNGCTPEETNILGLNKCSAFKCQQVLRVDSSSALEGPQQICCFGESGRSRIMRGATRMTIKLQDLPDSKFDPLLRVCLNRHNPRLDLN